MPLRQAERCRARAAVPAQPQGEWEDGHESFATPAALRKAQREVAEFQRWQQLGQELVAINQKICALRPLAEEGSGWTPQEKKRLLRFIRKLRGR
jgi:hypothetical protein